MTAKRTLDLFLFTVDAELARGSVQGGAAGLVIDWERRGKVERQSGADTLVSDDEVRDLTRMRDATAAPIICRLDPVGEWTRAQLELAFDLGADEVLLPMIRRPEEVETVLAFADGRPVAILIETMAAVAQAETLAGLGVSRIYVGLNDLSIDRGSDSIFAPLHDGTLDAVREAVGSTPFGFGGLTLPGLGSPVPSVEIMGHLARLDASFTFLRRSFWRDVAGRDPAAAVREILRAYEDA